MMVQMRRAIIQLHPEEIKICVVYKYANMHYAETYIVLHAEHPLARLINALGMRLRLFALFLDSIPSSR